MLQRERSVTFGRVMRAVVLLGAVACAGGLNGALAQPVVFLDDAPASGETIRTLPALIESGELSEAAREIQRLFDLDTGRVLSEPGDSGAHRSVRFETLRALLESPELLERYRQNESRRAQTMLAAGELVQVEQTRWPTRAGFAASLSLAAQSFESGAFDAAGLSLRQLLGHPDAAEPGLAGPAAGLAAQVASYQPRFSTLAERWADRAGVELELAPVSVPASLRSKTADALRGGGVSLKETFLPSPMWSAELGLTPVRRQQSLATEVRAYPTISEDLLLINAGEVVRAWDRFTLQPRWTFQPEDDANRLSMGADPYSVTATPAGFVVEMPARGGGIRVAMLAREDGALLWSEMTSDMGDGLSDAELAGPPLVAGDTIVVALEATERLRRLRSFIVVGLDAATGDVRWRRLVSSSGVERNSRSRRAPIVPALSDGMVYVGSTMGVIGALEAHTGRVQWVRTLEEETDLNPTLRTRGVQQSNLVVVQDRLIMVAPDRRSVLAFDADSGALVERLEITGTAPPAYLHVWNDRVLMVARDQVVSVAATDLNGPWQRVASYSSGTLVARSMLAGDQLVLPLANAIALVDLPNGSSQLRPIDSSGSVVVSSGQAIAVDDQRVYSYLAWPVAEQELIARMDADPERAAPSITYLRLALRAQRYARIAEVVERATQVLEMEADDSDRIALFETLRGVLEPVPLDGSAPTGEAPENPEAQLDAAQAATLTAELRQTLIGMLDQIAVTPDERVAQRVLAARLAREIGKPREAVDALQSILSEPELARARWDDGRIQIGASVAATRFLRRLIQEEGASVYSTYAGRAARELDQLGRGASVESLEALAREFPLSRATARAWLLAADGHAESGNSSAEILALETGLALYLADRGVLSADDEIASELAGRLVFALDSAGRSFAAATTLGRLSETPGLERPTVRGVAFDLTERLESLRERLRGAARYAQIGTSVSEPIQVISGWRLVEPMFQDGSPPPTGHVMLQSETSALLALFATGAADAGEAGELRAVWARSTRQGDPRLLRLDPETAMIVWTEPAGVSVERIDTVTGETIWKTDPMWDVLGEPPAVEEMGRILETPLDGTVTYGEVIVHVAGQMLFLVQRNGRAIGIELSSGNVLWTREESGLGVFDLASDDNVLAIIGEQADATGRSQSVLLQFDARTGERSAETLAFTTGTRWVRLTEGGAIVVGTDAGISLISRDDGLLWTTRDPGAQLSADAWTLLDRIMVMGADRRIRLFSRDTGTLIAPGLSDRGRLGAAVQVRGRSQQDRALFLSDRGVLMYDDSGALAGVDALSGLDEIVLPVLGDGVIVMLTRPRSRDEQGQYECELWFMSATSGRLLNRQRVLLGATPSRLALLDGRVLITAGGVTLGFAAQVQHSVSAEPQAPEAIERPAEL